jgi:hypothetical protein
MIICSICKIENDQYATICKSCGGFLQNRVPNLDLFSTLWEMIENPKNAFRLIMRAEHKNYSLFLYCLFGVSLSFTGFWFWRIGEIFENILLLIFWALVSGILMGIVLCPFLTSWHWILSVMLKGKATFKTSLGIMSYSFLPIIISSIFILPIKLLTFGMYLYTFNPHPFTVKPLVYSILIGLDIVLILWSILLSMIGTKIGYHLSVGKSIIIGLSTYLIIACGLVYGGEFVLKLL